MHSIFISFYLFRYILINEDKINFDHTLHKQKPNNKTFLENGIKREIFQQDADTQKCGKAFNIDTQFHIQTDG